MGVQEQQLINEAFELNWIAPVGPHLQKFEQAVIKYTGAGGAVALTSGTAGIHLALRASGIKEGDIVFCSSFTFVASVNPILYMAAVPVLIDSEPEGWNMSPEALRTAFRKYEKKGMLPKAVLVVNLYGQSADLKKLKAICDHYEVPIIEDAAESLGATHEGMSSGTIGKYGVFSFNGNKIITTSNGGMVVSDDASSLEKIRYWSTQAKDPADYYQHSEVGYNYRLSNVLAAIGCAQMSVLDQRIEARRNVFRRYYEALHEIKGISFTKEIHGCSTRWLTTLKMNLSCFRDTPETIVKRFEQYNIETRRLWKPMHAQPLYTGCDYVKHADNQSICDELFETGICLPSSSNLSVEDQNKIIKHLKNFLAESKV
ncbi:pyridoxal phosphate-dependent aminotransferase [Jeotgalibacillus salarius]|uniref:Pyridoxal phosphate-dependent aminotransferase n=2 Tax=Jeotgalibacillus salarius TaxID=546023 RepID=A0A4Y8LQE0_9BACL|nr:pyridoxal phosphate-dependent aminotransferase [Jeotgalibacillus salarius]